MRVSVIATVRNEEASIADLLTTRQEQTRQPDEIIICDGGSGDRTVEILRSWVQRGLPLHVIEAPHTNIAQGRNRAIAAASGEIIASTDAGVRLSPRWLDELTAPFASPQAPDVVGGFFIADAHNAFETAMGATVLPALADIRPAQFLPSSRSVAFRKSAWQAVGGYPEWLDYCEDLVFDFALRRAGFRFAFAPDAIVYFRPRPDLRAFFQQYYRYARGDGKANLWPKRHAVRYLTYILAPLVMALGLRYTILWVGLALAGLAYCWRPYQRLWPHLRAYGPRTRLYALALVPLIRFVGDVAKMIGYPVGLWCRLTRHRRSEMT